MLFNSIAFLIFLPIVFSLYWFVFNKNLNRQNGLILLASYFFYGWWSWKFMGLLMLSTLLDYLYGFSVASPNRKKAKIFLWLSVINNLGILAVFKYYNFFATQIQLAFNSINIHLEPALLTFALPIGISFYTFHGMSYVFDIYRGHQKPVTNIISYSVFVSFFPLLVAGPIERANHLLPQILKPRSFNYHIATNGMRLIIWGLFKKIVIADSLAPIVTQIYSDYSSYNQLTVLLAIFYFSIQIYCDFSGYSDIALGTAKLFGFELLRNFKFPYFSRDIAEFWRRWHISLSSWFKDYLYIPLGGSKEGKFKSIRNTFTIFLVSGFWHGANWNFIIWGFLHALAFLPQLIFNTNRKHITDVVAQNSHLPSWKELLGMTSTFVLVSFAWIFFRNTNLQNAFGIIGHATNFSNPFSFPQFTKFLIYPLILFIVDWFNRNNSGDFRLISPQLEKWLFFPLISLMIIYHSTNQADFIYFAF